MTLTHLEREDKFDVAAEFAVPDVAHKPAREAIRLPDKGRKVPDELESLVLGVTRDIRSSRWPN